MTNETEVKLIARLQGVNEAEGLLEPDNIPVYATRGCSSDQTLLELMEADLDKDVDNRLKDIDKTYKDSSGRGHGAVLDMSAFMFQIKDLPRISTLHLCLPQYLEHLQQSLRWSDASRGFFLPDSIKDSDMGDYATEVLEEALGLYDYMVQEDIPKEDARFVAPLYTRTNINSKGNARELMHLHYMADLPGTPSITRDIIYKMIELTTNNAPRLMKRRANNYEPLGWMPCAQLFGEANATIEALIDEHGNGNVVLLGNCSIPMSADSIERAVKERDEAELANLKHFHFTFLAPMSLACFHQAIRQRTWDQSVESIYAAADRGEFVTPPSIRKAGGEILSKYNEMNDTMLTLYDGLVKMGISSSDASGVLPHSLKVYDIIHVNGWNAIHSIGKRTCTKAQWEIRWIAKEMAAEISTIDPALGEYAKPQGINYGKCPEKKSCKQCL